MKIAILYENKFEETEHLAQFLTHQIGTNGNVVELFKILAKNPNEIINFNPEVILVIAPAHDCKWPCHFGKTARLLKKFGKLLKKGAPTDINKIGVFNCNEPKNYKCKIKETITKAFPQAKTYFFPSFKTNYYRIFK